MIGLFRHINIEKTPPRKTLLPLLALVLFAQCRGTDEPLGYYYEEGRYFKPEYVFYYNDSVHHCYSYFDEEYVAAFTDSMTNVFRQGRDVHAFYNGDIQLDTLLLTIDYPASFAPHYHFVYTPSACKFYLYNRCGPRHLTGTYEFVPNRAERGLVSFAASRLDFGDTVPTFMSFNNQPDSVIIEPIYCTFRLKSDKLNLDFSADLTADEATDALCLLVDAINTLVDEHCKPQYRTTEQPSEEVWHQFEKRICDKYPPPPPPTFDD